MINYSFTDETLLFRAADAAPQALVIDHEQSETPVTVNGTSGADEIYGSEFSDKLNGKNGADQIYGNFGNDTINGGLGKDRLYGEDGRDTFVFDSKLGPANVDAIGDFRFKDDAIKLDGDVFSWAGQTAGTIKAGEFKVVGNGQKIDANDHVVYNQQTGVLSYDVDGKGGQAMVKFALIENFSGDVPIVTYQDILIA